MKCHKTQELLGDYLDGALAPAREREVARHLAECPDCRRVLVWWKDTFYLLQGMEMPDPGEELVAEIMARVSAEPAPGSFPVNWRGWLLAAAAWMVLTAAGVLLSFLFRGRLWQWMASLGLQEGIAGVLTSLMGGWSGFQQVAGSARLIVETLWQAWLMLWQMVSALVVAAGLLSLLATGGLLAACAYVLMTLLRRHPSQGSLA